MDIDLLIKKLKNFKKSGVNRVVLNGNKFELFKASHEVLFIVDLKEESL